MKTLRKPEPEQSEELQPRNAQRADITPIAGFSMVVDGKLKANFDDEKVAKAAGVKLLEQFPMLRVEVYDAETKVRTLVEHVG